MTDKLAMIDMMFDERSKRADMSTEHLIRHVLPSHFDDFRGDPDRLLTLHSRLIEQKHAQVIEMQATRYREHMKNEVKRALRDDRKFLKRL